MPPRSPAARLVAAAAALLLVAATPAPPRTEGALVYDGVPEVPAALVARAAPYANLRSARLWGFHPTDGSILVATRFGETTQAHRVAGPGMAREQLTFHPETVGGYTYDLADLTGAYLRADEGGGEFYQVWWLDRGTGQTTLLSPGGRTVTEPPAVSRAGGRIAFTSTARNGTDYDLYLLDHHDPATRRLAHELAGDWSITDWSPDDGRLLLQHYTSVREVSLHVYDLAADTLTELRPAAGPVALTAGRFAPDGRSVYAISDEGSDFARLVRIDPATNALEVVVDPGRWDVDDVKLSRDGAWIAWSVNAGGRSELTVAPVAKVGDPRRHVRVDLPVGVVYGFGFDHQGQRLGLTLSTAQTPGDVYVLPLPARGPPVRWTYSEIGGLDAARFTDPELVEVPAADGVRVPAWVYRAPAASPARAPVIISVHGGPEGQSTAAFSSNVQYLRDALGVAVIAPNVRGSTGYGKTYVTLDDGLNRLASVRDIGAILDWIATQPDLDPDRVAIMGGSYGGYMVLAAMVEYGPRIRCGADSVGISNFVSFLENTESYRRDLRRAEYGDERIPEVRAFLERIAPLNNVDRIVRPLFVSQGLNDPRVPASEADQIVRSIRARDGDVWYLLATDEGHGFRKRSNREAWLAATTLFLQRELLGNDEGAEAGGAGPTGAALSGEAR